MEWHKLVDHPNNRSIDVWMTDGREVWITNMLSAYWPYAQDGMYNPENNRYNALPKDFK